MAKESALEKKTDKRGKNSGGGRKKTNIIPIENKSQRMVSFSKRKSGLLKKVSEFQRLTGQNIVAVVFSPAGRLYTSGNGSSFDAIIDHVLQVTGDPSTPEFTGVDNFNDSALPIGDDSGAQLC